MLFEISLVSTKISKILDEPKLPVLRAADSWKNKRIDRNLILLAHSSQWEMSEKRVDIRYLGIMVFQALYLPRRCLTVRQLFCEIVFAADQVRERNLLGAKHLSICSNGFRCLQCRLYIYIAPK